MALLLSLITIVLCFMTMAYSLSMSSSGYFHRESHRLHMGDSNRKPSAAASRELYLSYLPLALMMIWYRGRSHSLFMPWYSQLRSQFLPASGLISFQGMLFSSMAEACPRLAMRRKLRFQRNYALPHMSLRCSGHLCRRRPVLPMMESAWCE